MTEALSQNLENTVDAALEMLSVSTSGEGVDTEQEPAFSNLINALSANIEQAQSDFEELAAQEVALKTNISSINQLALNPKTDETLSQEQEPKELVLSNEIVNALEEVEQIEETKTTAEVEQTEEVEKTQENNQIEEVVKPQETKTTESLETSNNQHTSEKNEQQKEENKKEEEQFDKIPPLVIDALNQNGDLDEIKTFIEDDFKNIDSIEPLEELDSAINNVLNLLDNIELPDEQKTKINETFSKLKKVVEKAKETIDKEDTAILDDAKETLEGIISKVSQGNFDNNAVAVNTQELEALVKQSQTISLNEADDSLADALQEAREVLKQTVEAINSGDSEFLNDASYKLEEAAKNIQEAMSNSKNTDETIVGFTKQMLSVIKALNEKLPDDNLETLDKDIELNLNTNNTTKVVELLNQLKDNSSLTKEEKTQVENVIKQINNTTKNVDAAIEVFKNDFNKKEQEEFLSEFDNSVSLNDKVVDGAPDAQIAYSKETFGDETKKTSKENTKDVSKEDSFIDAINDEIVLDVKFSKIPPVSGALSVVDEVAKLALNEERASVFQPSNALNQTAVKQTSSFGVELERSDILNQLGNKLTQLKETGAHKMTLVLRPNDLGRLSIELKSDASGLTTHIVAQNSEVRSYIENNINTLRQNLADAGVNVNNIRVKTAGEAGFSNYEGQDSQSDAQEQQGQQGQKQQQQKQQKELEEELKGFLNYDMAFSRDFSSVLNKTLSYSLN